MSDVFHRLMVITGDVVISSISLKTPRSKPLPRKVEEMLNDPPVVQDSDCSDLLAVTVI